MNEADLLNLGNNYFKSGRLSDAQISYKKVIDINPKNVSAIYLIGVINLINKKFEIALNLFSDVIKIDSGHYHSYCNRGISNHSLKKYPEAIFDYDHAIRLKPDYYQVYLNRGNTFKEIKQFEKAILDYDQAIKFNSNYVEAFSNRGNTFQLLDMPEKAILDYDMAIKINPNLDYLYNNKALVYSSLENFQKAINNYDFAIKLNPNNYEYYYNRANAYFKLRNYNNAILDYDKSVLLYPKYLNSFYNKGNLFLDLNNYEEAITNFNRVIEIDPNNFRAYCNRGFAYQSLHKFDEAMSDYDYAIYLNKHYHKAKLNKGYLSLLLGDFAKGWDLHESRLKLKIDSSIAKKFSSKRWNGDQNIINKKILIYSEQGIGDIILFSRYCKLVQQLGAFVYFQVPSKLFSILSSLEGVNKIIDNNIPSDVDFYCSLLSLPSIFKTNLKTIPASSKYLNPTFSKNKIIKWKNYLSKEKFKISICWHGNINYRSDKNRSFEVNFYKNISKFENVELISLQKNFDNKNLLNEMGIKYLPDDFDDGNNAFIDSAIVMSLSNLVITSDTSLTHLAGAMGLSTWLVLNKVPDWRWMLNINYTPWYPNHRIFRQKKNGDWDSVFDEIQKELYFKLKKSK